MKNKRSSAQQHGASASGDMTDRRSSAPVSMPVQKLLPGLATAHHLRHHLLPAKCPCNLHHTQERPLVSGAANLPNATLL